MAGVGVDSCARRVVVEDGVDRFVVTVDAVVVSAGVPGGTIESMNSVGESMVGVDRRVLRRRDTVLREGCGVPAGGVEDVVLVLVVVLFAPGLMAAPARREELVERVERVLPREESLEALDLAEDHMSLSVRGDLARLGLEGGGLEVGSASISIASSDGGGWRRWGEAEISSALRVREESC